MRRFHSDALRSEALAHESLTARQGLGGKCWCLVCLFFVCWGFKSLFNGGVPWRFSGWSRTAPTPSPALSAALSSPLPPLSPSPDLLYSSTTHAEFDVDFRYSTFREDPTYSTHLGVDYSIVSLLFAGFAIVACPCLMRASGSGSGYGNDAMQIDQSRNTYGSAWNRSVPNNTPTFGAPGAGTYGSSFGNGFGNQFGAEARSFGADLFPRSSPGTYPMGAPAMFGAQGGAFGANNFFGNVPSNLPVEAELTDTYNSFGSQLQQCLPRLSSFIERHMVAPLVQEIDDSDRMWNQALTAMNWRLTDQPPQQSFMVGGMGIGPQTQELSIFDPQLPYSLQQDPRAVELWNRRQFLETYLRHPHFSQVPQAELRKYVFNRLREWQTRGLLNAMKFDARSYNHLPTDGHILESILIKALNTSMDFENSFVGTYAPPLAKHMGQSSPVYLRQVNDQTVNPKPPPHYEVVSQAKVWKLRPGNTNLLEALQILIHLLRQCDERLYKAFPAELRGTIEDMSMFNWPFRMFNSWFG